MSYIRLSSAIIVIFSLQLGCNETRTPNIPRTPAPVPVAGSNSLAGMMTPEMAGIAGAPIGGMFLGAGRAARGGEISGMTAGRPMSVAGQTPGGLPTAGRSTSVGGMIQGGMIAGRPMVAGAASGGRLMAGHPMSAGFPTAGDPVAGQAIPGGGLMGGQGSIGGIISGGQPSLSGFNDLTGGAAGQSAGGMVAGQPAAGVPAGGHSGAGQSAGGVVAGMPTPGGIIAGIPTPGGVDQGGVLAGGTRGGVGGEPTIAGMNMNGGEMALGGDMAGGGHVPMLEDGLIRLVRNEGEDGETGRLEVVVNGAWAEVCDDQWNLVDADVACRQLGYSGAKTAIVSIGGGVGPVGLDNVQCVGEEERLIECARSADEGINCKPEESVTIQCLADGECRVDSHCLDEAVCGEGGQCVAEALCGNGSREGLEVCDDGNVVPGDGCSADCLREADALLPGDLRLADGAHPWEGRVEIFNGANWGTVCDRDWDQLDASVACRQLGFVSARRAVPQQGGGQGAIFLSQLDCVGDEARLSDCLSVPGPDNCDHGRDAGVVCSNTRVAPGTDRIEMTKGIDSFVGGFEAGTSDLFLFTADGASSVSITVSDGQGGCPGDTVMTLYRITPDGSVGDVLLRNDNRVNPRSLCSQISGNLPAGRYGVLVSGKNDLGIQEYVIDLALWQSLIATGDYAGAYALGGNDAFRFDRDVLGQVILTTSNGMDECPAGTDTSLSVYEFQDGIIGDQIIRDGDGGPGACSSVNVQLDPGSYIAIVSGFLGGRSDGYTLSARFIDVEAGFQPIRIQNTGLDTSSARLRATCVDTGAQCYAEGTSRERNACEIHCPAASRVDICCATGSAGCGGKGALSQVRTINLNVDGLQMTMCSVQANGSTRCNGTIEDLAVEAQCIFGE